MAAEQEVRRRPLREEEDEKKDEKKDEEDWGVDDEGWTPEEETEEIKQKHLARRTVNEIVLSFLCHLLIMCFYIHAHVYDATIYKRNAGKGFEGSETYGGRWKFLTWINFWLQFLYFFLGFFTDIMPRSGAKFWFQKLCDLVFTTVVFPFAIFIAVAFWGIYAIDRELIYPSHFDEYIPPILNHYWHTFIAVGVLIEVLVVFHRYPSTGVAATITFFVSTAYIVWIVNIFTVTKKWVYPFLNKMPPPVISLFFAACFFVTLGIYLVGKIIAYRWWGERHRYLDKQQVSQ